MRVFVYDPATGAFIAPVDLDDSFRDPLRPNRFAIPGDATDVAPPEAGAGKAAVWRGDRWNVVPDHRGERWWTDQGAVTITELGDPAAAGCRREPNETQLGAIKAHLCGLLDQQRDAVTERAARPRLLIIDNDDALASARAIEGLARAKRAVVSATALADAERAFADGMRHAAANDATRAA